MAILTEHMKKVVAEQALGFVATVCPDGTPNLSPKGTTAVWDDDRLVFADIASPTTMANLAANPAIEVNVVDPVLRKGYRFKGTATVHVAGSVYDDVVRFYEARGLDRHRIAGVAMITVERAARLVSPAYTMGTTEDEVRARFMRRLEEVHGWTIQPSAAARRD
jgi:uncharacterized protein